MSMRWFLSALLAVSSHCVAASELKGVALGMTLEQLKAVLPEGARCEAPRIPSPMADMFCSAHTTLGGAPARMFVLLKGDSVQSVTFKFLRQNFATVKAGLVEKFGEPTEAKVETVQNRMGASFPSQRDVWQVPGGRVVSEEVSGKIDESSVILISNDADANVPDGKAAARDM